MSGRKTCLVASSIGRRSISTSSSNKVATSQTKPAWLSFSKEQEKTSGHSSLLSKDQFVYELVTDVVIPSQWEAYKTNKRLQVELTRDSPGIKGELVGSWRSVTGDVAFKATHLYKYQDGWNDIDSDRQAKKHSKNTRNCTVRVCPRSTNNRASLRKPSCSGQVLMLEKGQMFMTSGHTA